MVGTSAQCVCAVSYSAWAPQSRASLVRRLLHSQREPTWFIDQVTALLSLLAPACPSLQQLQLTGNIGRGLLTTFGAHCKQLTCLEITEGVEEESLTQLHQILPKLTHCKIAQGHWWGAHQRSDTTRCCRSLLTCTTLTSLDLSDTIPAPEVWREPPPGLRDLRCMLSKTLPRGLVFGELKSLQCGLANNGGVMLEDIAAFLRMAPQLERVKLVAREAIVNPFAPAIEVNIQASTASDLVYLHERVSSGLAVTSPLYTSANLPGLNLKIVCEQDVEFTFADYLATLPIFNAPGAFTGLSLWSYKPEPCFPSVVKVIAARFPQVTTLAFRFDAGTLTIKDLKHLALFPAVQRLSLRYADLTESSLAILCSRMASLKYLQIYSFDFFHR